MILRIARKADRNRFATLLYGIDVACLRMWLHACRLFLVEERAASHHPWFFVRFTILPGTIAKQDIAVTIAVDLYVYTNLAGALKLVPRLGGSAPRGFEVRIPQGGFDAG